MKKILVVCAVAYMVERFNMPNLRILKDLGFEVGVACNFIDAGPISAESVNKLKLELKEMNIPYYQVDFARGIGDISQNMRSYRQLKALVQKGKYNVIHCHSPLASAITRLLKLSEKVKIIYTAHGFHFYKNAPWKNWIIYYPVEKLCSYLTDVLITINNEDFSFAKRKLSAKKVFKINGVGVDTKKFSTSSIQNENLRHSLGLTTDDTMLLSVGELSVRKNHEVVIQALNKLKNRNLHYFIAGTGELRKALEELANQLDLQDNVHFLGYRLDISELLSCCDIYIFPSKQEGLPMALMEAMAANKLIICSNIRGNTDLVVNELGGFLCEASSAEEFAIAIEKTATLPVEQRATFRANNLRKLQDFDLEVVLAQTKVIYSDFIGDS